MSGRGRSVQLKASSRNLTNVVNPSSMSISELKLFHNNEHLMKKTFSRIFCPYFSTLTVDTLS